ARRLAERGVPFVFYTGQIDTDPAIAEWSDHACVHKPAPSGRLVEAVAVAARGEANTPPFCRPVFLIKHGTHGRPCRRGATDMKRIASLDDYLDLWRVSGDWSSTHPAVELVPFRDHLDDEDAIVERLRDFEIVLAWREKTPMPARLIERLPKLEFIAT